MHRSFPVLTHTKALLGTEQQPYTGLTCIKRAKHSLGTEQQPFSLTSKYKNVPLKIEVFIATNVHISNFYYKNQKISGVESNSHSHILSLSGSRISRRNRAAVTGTTIYKPYGQASKLPFAHDDYTRKQKKSTTIYRLISSIRKCKKASLLRRYPGSNLLTNIV
jgi:hypothetical protein